MSSAFILRLHAHRIRFGERPAGYGRRRRTSRSAAAEAEGRGHDSKHPRIVDSAVKHIRPRSRGRQHHVIGGMNAAIDVEGQITVRRAAPGMLQYFSFATKSRLGPETAGTFSP